MPRDEQNIDFEPQNRPEPKVENRRSLYIAGAVLLLIVLLFTFIFLMLPNKGASSGNDIPGDSLATSESDLIKPPPPQDPVDFQALLDSCMYSAVRMLGADPETIKKRRSREECGLKGLTRARYYVNIPTIFPTALANDILTREFRRQGCDIIDGFEVRRGYEIELHAGINGVITHEIVLTRSKKVELAHGKAALLIGGFGEIPDELAKGFSRLDIPFTAAIIPFSANLPAQRDMLSDKELFCAIPMEPIGWRGGPESRRNMIFTTHSDAEIRKIMEELLEITGSVSGATNLMGSRATADVRVMHDVLSMLKDRSIPFVDSRTTPYTVTDTISKKLELVHSMVDFSIGNSDTASGVMASELYTSALAARGKDRPVIISFRANKNTLDMLKRHIDHIERLGIDFDDVGTVLGSE